MKVISEKTLNGNTYKLNRDKTHKDGVDVEYYVTRNGSIQTEPIYSEKGARAKFQSLAK